jgi:hypothetical protein
MESRQPRPLDAAELSGCMGIHRAGCMGIAQSPNLNHHLIGGSFAPPM